MNARVKMLTAEEIKENYEKFVSYAMRTGDHRKDALQKFFDHFEERLALCPASSKLQYHNCFPGGLVEHSLRVLKNCNKLIQVFKDDFEFSKESMIFACLFHDIGKIGMIDHSRYVEQTSDWHKRQGNVYEYNSQMPFLTTPHASVFLLQHFGVHMTFDEFQAILLNDGPVLQENKIYAMKESQLALLVHQADRLACEMVKRNV